jgi:hypothetical protein
MELCPLLLISNPPEKAQCKKEDCKWYTQIPGTQPGRGLCSISRIGYELSAVNSELHNLMRLLGDKL